jgi:putative integral membrane protein (TIGR02587 family)
MWWRGMTLSAEHLLMLLGATLVVNFGFCLFSGFRHHYSVAEAAGEAVTAVALGLLYSVGVLLLIGEITGEAGWADTVGRVLVETAPVSLGIAFANKQVLEKAQHNQNGGNGRKGDDGDDGDDGGDGGGAGAARAQQRATSAADDLERLQLRQDLRDLAATVGGAAIFSYNLAPTEEIIKIAFRLTPWQLLIMMAASLVLCYVILFASGFRDRHVFVSSPFQSPLAETVMAYAASLVVAAGLLALVGMPEAMDGPAAIVSSTVTLGLPAVVGASAGRLII